MGLSMMSLGMVLGRRRLQQATAHALHAVAAWAREMSSLPKHQVVGMPALSPTMTQGNLAKWHVKVGDAIQPGSILADVATDKATMPFENQDAGYVAKLLVKEGASNLPLGTPLLVVVEEEKSVSAFAQYSEPDSAAPTTSASAAPASPPPSPPASQPTSSPASEYPPHQILCMPSLAATPTMMEYEAKILAWRVKEGESVKAGQIIYELEGFKAQYEAESPCDAVIAKILTPAGNMDVEAGAPVAVLVDNVDLVPEFKDFSLQEPEPASSAQPKAAAAPNAPRRVDGPATQQLLEIYGLSVSDIPPSVRPFNDETIGDVMRAVAAGVKPGSGTTAPAEVPADSPPPRQPSASASTTTPASEYPPHEVLCMPPISPVMHQANILAWMVKEGDSVKDGQTIYEIETLKCYVDIKIHWDAVIAKILTPAGSMDVHTGTPVAVLVDDVALVPQFKDFSLQKPELVSSAEPEAAATPSKPVVIANHQLGPEAAAAATVRADKPASPIQPPACEAAPAAPTGQSPSFTDIPNTQIRKVIAQRLLESKVTIPSLYGAVDVEIDALSTLRKSLAEQGVKLSVNDFVLKAIARALKEVPAANSLWDASKQEAMPAPSIDISVAVATERGLITPIVKNADQKTLSQISKDVKDLAAKAKANKLKPEEFMGGSFTVSNLGMYGVLYFSAIINPPQGAILAVGGTQQRVRLVHGKPEAYHVMTVTLSGDHRMYDGELLGQVLGAFKQHMQAPAALIM